MVCGHLLTFEFLTMPDRANASIEIIRYNIPPDLQVSFEKAYREASIFLESSPFCLGYKIIHGHEEPQHYIVIIQWTSVDEHLNGFRKSEQFPAFFRLVKPFFNNIEEMKHYEQTGISWKGNG